MNTRPNLLYRIRRGLSAGMSAFRTAPNMKKLEIDLSKLNDTITAVEKQQDNHPSRLDIRETKSTYAYLGAYSYLRSFVKDSEIPVVGDPYRDEYLDILWRKEPILAGAVYSMTAKMTALKWMITGRRLVAKKAATLLASAAHFDGYDWGGFISSTGQDFYCADRGVFWESPHSSDGTLEDLGHIDSLSCVLTGNRNTPMQYVSELTGQNIMFRPGEYIHFASLPSSRERHLGNGFCAVSRAYRAAKLLITVHDYDEQKLNNLPPEGVASVTGLTLDEFRDAMDLYKSMRQQNKELTFPDVLWLIGSQPSTEVKVALQGFSQLPESFDREKVVTQYVSTLALDFGVDPREFWPVSSGALGTASESEIQHQKARGKGPGEFISTTERHINGELPEDADFKYDTQDIEEDVVAANVAKSWIDAYWILYAGIPNPNVPVPQPPSPPGTKAGQQEGEPAGERPPSILELGKEVPPSKNGASPSNGSDAQKPTEQVITKDQLLRLLADRGVLPDWMVNDNRIVIGDSDVRIKSRDGHDNDITRFVWEKGILKEVRAPAIVLYSTPGVDVPREGIPVISNNGHNKITYASILKELKKQEAEIVANVRNIHGSPIPDHEVTRGVRVTAATIRAEISRWRADPLLSKYVPDEAEMEKLLASTEGRPNKARIVAQTSVHEA